MKFICCASIVICLFWTGASRQLVVGGNEAPMYKYPYTAGMRATASGRSFCGGTLIAPQYIVTATHCDPSAIKYVSVGSHFKQGASDGVQMKVSRVIPHPKNDIALVQLEKSVQNSSWIAYLGENVPSYQTVATLTGWGRKSFPGNASEVLKEIELSLVTPQECQKSLGTAMGMQLNHKAYICAGGQQYHGACHGDSGGPLVINKNGSPPILIGAVSFVKPCAKGIPDAYARISNFRDFIDTHVTGHTWATV